MPVGTLSQVQIDSFHDRGVLVVPDLLHSDEVSRIAAAAREEFETHRYMDAKARFPAPTKYILSEDSLRAADIRLVVDHPRIVTAVSELLADEVCLSAFVIYSMPPGTEGTGGDYQRTHETAHCDYKPFRPVGSSLRWLFAIVPLVDYTDEVGPLLVSPGSHKIPELTRRGRVTHVRRARAGDLPALVDTRLRRGQVAFMDMFTWHQAYGNRSDQLRYGVYNKYRVHSAPPGCGPYLFRTSSAELFGATGATAPRCWPTTRRAGSRRPGCWSKTTSASWSSTGPFPAVPRSRVRSTRAPTKTTSSPSSWTRPAPSSAASRRG